MNREETGWILYDVANSAFVLIIVTAVMPLFFKEIAATSLTPAASTAWWGYANSASSVILALVSPFLGVCADYPGWKKRLFTLFLLTGVAATTLLAGTGPGEWVFCLALFVIARTGWGGANIFYDAFLTDIAPPARMDRVSTAGFAWGYIGSVIPFLAVIGLILRFRGGQSAAIPLPAARYGFLLVALWWLTLSLPLLKNVRQRHFCPASGSPAAAAFTRLRSTLSRIREHRNVFLFLTAYFFYIDGVDTIITMSVAYGADIGLGSSTLILAILAIQVIAFPCALFWGRLSDRFPVRGLLQAGIAMYVLITLLAFLMPQLPTREAKTALFWTLAILVATSMGGLQALSRSYFGKLIPPERSAEFFGFYNIFGKFATIAGPLLVGAVGQATGQTRYGVLGILLLFITGSLILRRVDDHA